LAEDSSDHALQARRTHAVFFRNLNLGRPGKPDRAQLEAAFAAAGARAVVSFLSTGNIVFGAAGDARARRIVHAARVQLKYVCGFDEPACLRRLSTLARLVRSDPFAGVAPGSVFQTAVSFFDRNKFAVLDLPLRSARGDIDVLRIEDGVAFSLIRLVNERPGNVNTLLEKLLGGSVTTRNWNTVLRLVARYAKAKAPEREPRLQRASATFNRSAARTRA
jgi:uncharacterized protein (DUF1697 family)